MTCLFWIEGMPLWLQCSGWVVVDGGWGNACPGRRHVMALETHPRGFRGAFGSWESLGDSIFAKNLKVKQQLLSLNL